MDREAFKQRMQSLKSYREQNPGKGYLDWKASLPDNLQDDSSYNLKRAYELGYEPEYIEEDRSYHLPTRDSETGEILKKPWYPTFLIGLQEDAKLGYYPQTVDGTTYTTTWEGNENPIYKYKDGGEVGDKIIDTLDPSKVKDSEGVSLRQTLENLHNRFPNEPESSLKPIIDTEREWYDYLITDGNGYVDAGQIPEVTIKPTQIYTYLDTYYPITSKQYKYTGHSSLIHDGLNINKGGKNKGYNLVTNNCADATLGALELISGKKANPFLFTTPGDVRDFALEKLSGEIVQDSKKHTRVRIPINVTQSKKLREYIISGKQQRKFADGGEVPPTNKPTIVEPIPYKGKLYSDRYGKKYTEEQVYDYYNNGTDEIDRFTGGPLVRGLKPLLDLEDAANFTPVGDAVAAYDIYDAVSNKDWSGAGLAALGLVPFVPMTVKQFRSKYKGVTPKIKRQVPTVNRKAVDSQLDFEIEKKRRQNQYFSKAKNEGYEIVQRITDDPEYLKRANQVKQQFGDDYITTYADLIQAYNEDPLKLPGIEFYNSTGKDRASMTATLESSNRFRNKQGPFPTLGEFNYRIDPSKTDLSGDVTLHEWNHLTDYMKNKAPLADGDSNMFYKMSKDISNKQIDDDYKYYSRPTEQKAYMNQVREYMFKNGMISKRGDNVDTKMLQNVLNSLSEIDSMKSAVRASKQFKNINKYTKWFNSIPLLGVGALGMYNYANTNE